MDLNWLATLASGRPAPQPLRISGSFFVGKVVHDSVVFPPIFPAGFNVRINKTVFVDVFELPGRKALQEVINSLAWIIYS